MAHETYLSSAILPECRKLSVEWIINETKKLNLNFDTIAVRGVSGLTMGSIVAYLLDKQLFVVRKGGSNSTHSNYLCESPHEVNSYIIIDDLICTGNTVKQIKRKVASENSEAKCLAIILYSDRRVKLD